LKQLIEQIIPVSLAAVLHVVLLVLMVYSFDFSAPPKPVTLLAINATLVTEEAAKPKPAPEPVKEIEPEPVKEPEPEPVIEEPQEDIAAAEELKRQADLKIEQQRIAVEARRQEDLKIEQRRIAAEKKRKEQEEIDRKKREQDAERKRQEDLARQRAENERKRKEAEEAKRKADQQAQFMRELEAEESLQEVLNSDLRSQYYAAIMQKIMRNWARPPSAQPGVECIVNVRLMPSGDVINVTIESCNGDEAVRRSVEAAVYKASPLPVAPDPRLFKRDLQIGFKPEQ
jgi:colicin import membrane protein